MPSIRERLTTLRGTVAQAHQRHVRRVAEKSDPASQAERDIAYGRELRRRRYRWGGPLQTLVTATRLSKVPNVTQLGVSKNEVSRYWGRHTVWSKPLLTAKSSHDYVREIREGREGKAELCNLHNATSKQTVLEFGCGIGNDVVGWLLDSDAKLVHAVDISAHALALTRQRLSLHRFDRDRVRLWQVPEEGVELPFEDGSIDRINSLGVVHHTTDPEAILREFHRVLAPDGEARLMNYNAASVRVHLDFAYRFQIRRGDYPGISPRQALERHADLGAPVVHCWEPSEFCDIAETAGFECAFLGGYFMPGEIKRFEGMALAALADERFSGPSREFIEAVEYDTDGLLRFNGLLCGQGGSYLLRKQPVTDAADDARSPTVENGVRRLRLERRRERQQGGSADG